MPKKLILDTGIISRIHTHRYPQLAMAAVAVVEQHIPCMTVPIAMEVEQWLMYAYKNSDTKRLKAAQDFIRQIQVLPYTRDAQKLSVEFAKRYSVGGVSDLMTAAIAATERIEVFTLNRKDYKHIQGVQLPPRQLDGHRQGDLTVVKGFQMRGFEPLLLAFAQISRQ